MSTFSVIEYKTHADDFLACFEQLGLHGLPKPKQYVLLSAYRAAEMGIDFMDCSFAVCCANAPIAIVMAHKNGMTLTFEASGVQIYADGYNKKTMRFIYDRLLQIAGDEGCTSLLVRDDDVADRLSPLSQDMFNANGVPSVKTSASVDLIQSEQVIFSGIRKSYRNQIYRGNEMLSFSCITAENPDRSLFDVFKDFHLKTAARQTRPDVSWQEQFKMIEAGHAELILGYMASHGLVSSALFTDFGPMTSYAVGVYERSLFDKPLAHANIYEGIKRAKARGQERFDLGVIIPYDADREKEYNIGKFKKGFCRSLSIHHEWRIII